MSRSLGAGLMAAAVTLSLGCDFFSLDEAPESSGGKPATGGSNGAGASGGTGGSTGGTGGSTGGTGGSAAGTGGSSLGGASGSGGASAGNGAAGTGTAGTSDMAGSGPTGGAGNGGAPATGGMAGAPAGGTAGASMGGMGGSGLMGCAALNPQAKAHGGHCYLLVTSTVSFDNAKNACMSLGGHLVTISSGDPLTQSDFDAEQAFVFDELGGKKETWIGLSDGRMPHDNGDGAEFKWVNDEPLTLENWNDNEPNHYQKNCMDGSSCYEHCVFIMADPAGKWNDELCETTKQYVCEWDMGG